MISIFTTLLKTVEFQSDILLKKGNKCNYYFIS